MRAVVGKNATSRNKFKVVPEMFPRFPRLNSSFNKPDLEVYHLMFSLPSALEPQLNYESQLASC